MGPLPKGDRSDDLQQESLTAFRLAIPSERFLFRDERTDDKGVDGSLELKVTAGFTNVRSQVQLKATDGTDLNVDGSFSLPVAVSNLNYLLNGPAPLYVVWIAPRKEFRYVWARDEARRLHQETPEWINQGSITLRFRELLISTSWDSVYGRIMREGQLHRQTHDHLAQTASAEPITLRIDSGTLKATTDQQAYEWITNSGLALVAAGHATPVRELIRMLPAPKASEPRVRLVSGYAAHSLGDNFSARADLGRAAMNRASFDAVDRYMLDALLIDCDYCLGRIDTQEIRARQLQLETEAPEPISLQLQLDRLRWDHIGIRDAANRTTAANELKIVVGKILSLPDAGESLKLRARLVRLYAEAADGNLVHVHNLTQLRARADMGMKATTPQILVQIQQSFSNDQRVDRESDECVREAIRLQHPLLIAEAILSRVIILIVRAMNARIMLSQPGKPGTPPSETALATGLNQLRYAESLFRAAGSDEGVVRAILLQADWMVTCGRPADAIECVRSVEAMASGIGSERQIQRIAEHLAGNTEHHRLLDEVSNPPDEVASLAARTDAELRDMAALSLDSLGLPRDRLPVLERECFSWRAISHEKMTWCQHLELIQDLRHEQSPLTHFCTDPERMCLCSLHKYQSHIPTPDWSVSISSFKSSRCTGCKDRSPRQDDIHG